MKTLKDRLESHYVVPVAQSKKLTKTARFRLHFNDVQSAIAHGVPLTVILAELNQDGFEITLPTLKSMLQRVRKENGLTTPQNKKKLNPQQIELGHSNTTTEPTNSKLTANNSPDNEEAEAEYRVLEEKYPYLEEYSHIKRFRKINDEIKIYGDTVEEQYYSMGGDPRDLKDLSSRKRSEKIDNRYFEIVSKKYIYKNIIKA